MKDFNEFNTVAVLFKMKYKGFDFKTLADLKKLIINDEKALADYLINNLITKANE